MSNNIRDPLARAFQLLRWFTRERLDSIGVREAASALSVAPSTAHNLLAALVAEGILQQDDRTGRYTLGLRASPACSSGNRSGAAAAAGDAAFAATRGGLQRGDAICRSTYASDPSSSRSPVSIRRIQSVTSSTCSRGGRCMSERPVGRSSRSCRRPIVRRSFRSDRRGDRNRLNRPDLARELVAIRKRGYAVTRGTRIEGAVGIAAPLLDRSGDVLGAVGIAMPEQRFDPADIERLAKPLLTCVRDLVDALGMAPLPEARRPAGGAQPGRTGGQPMTISKLAKTANHSEQRS